MRELTYYVASTVDGFIADPDGAFDAFLAEGEHLADLFAEFPETVPGHLRDAVGVRGENRAFDAVLMGRGTYDVGLALGVTSPYPHLRQYVFSRSLPASPDPAVTLVAGDAVAAVRSLKREPGRGIWLCGGGDLAAQLLPEIDQLILKVNPVLLGAGIPLFAGGAAGAVPLALPASRVYPNGFVLQRYRPRLSAAEGVGGIGGLTAGAPGDHHHARQRPAQEGRMAEAGAMVTVGTDSNGNALVLIADFMTKQVSLVRVLTTAAAVGGDRALAVLEVQDYTEPRS
jgi:dihydrofolate reductase